jgi:hypothetical protein
MHLSAVAVPPRAFGRRWLGADFAGLPGLHHLLYVLCYRLHECVCAFSRGAGHGLGNGNGHQHHETYKLLCAS